MKVIHLPFCFYPDTVGGTEVYVAGLAREQQLQGWDVVVSAPGAIDSTYLHEGVPVRRFALDPQVEDLSDLYSDGDSDAAIRFGKILDEEKPDIVHLHAFTRGVSLKHVQEARRRGIATVFSYHTPTVSCMRGTLMRNGVEVCDGKLDTFTCASCNLNRLGAGGPVGALLAMLPSAAGRTFGFRGASGRIATALRMTELVEYRHSAFRALLRDIDCVVALCNWSRDLLLRSGAPEEKVTLSRQGIARETTTGTDGASGSKDLRVAFLGRLVPEKGLHVLIEAMRRIPAASIQLHVYGLAQSESDKTYQGRVCATAVGDSRISFHEPVQSQEVLSTLGDYDLVAVPSQWLETGPMVVLEAFAAGVPVIGSRLGGIAELVKSNVNGLLIEPRATQDWADALAMFAGNRDLLGRLRAGIKLPRTMRDVAREIDAIYERVLSGRIGRAAVCAGVHE